MKSNITHLPNWDLFELKKLYKSEKNEKVKLRFLCAIHRKQGKSILKIAELLCLPKSTVHDYLNRFKTETEVEKISDKLKSGRPFKLSKSNLKFLSNSIEKSPKELGYDTDAWSTGLIRIFIKEKFNKKYTMFGTRKLLKKLGFSLQKPRPIHHLGNKLEQEEFKKNFHKQLNSIKKMDIKSSFWMKPHS